MKWVKCSSWKLSSSCKRSGPDIWPSFLRRTELLAFCFDYRKLYAVTIQYSYTVPRMDECIDFLGHATIFSTLDADSSHFRVKIPKEGRDRTSFASPHGLFRFTSMLSRLINARRTFQQAMGVLMIMSTDTCLRAFRRYRYISAYAGQTHRSYSTSIDDIVRRWGNHESRRMLIFHECYSFSCSWHSSCTSWSVNTNNWPHLQTRIPTTKKEMRSFLGRGNVFRRFVPKGIWVTALLNENLCKNQCHTLDGLANDEITESERLKAKLTGPSIVSLPFSIRQYSG